ncbi:hypothetical protein ACFQZ4_10890 [Catellatospora coxensis]
MLRTDSARRLLALAAAVAVLAIALLIRALAGGPLEQHSGTALYASMIYAECSSSGRARRPWSRGRWRSRSAGWSSCRS